MQRILYSLSFGVIIAAVLILIVLLLILAVLTALIVLLLVLSVLLVPVVLLLTVIILIRHSNTSFLRASFRHPFRKYYIRPAC